MELRKLDEKEYGITRSLWEEVFPEDSSRFLDYYYFMKTRDNEIYGIWEDGGLRSMLQLNPYHVRVEDREFLLHYIIAVSTQERYRGRGYMRRLLLRSMEEMYNRKEPFTFLMPAAEAIYYPYGFRFVYSQKQTWERGIEGRSEVSVTEAGLWDAPAMSEFFARHMAPKYQVCTVRDGDYYRTMIMEQQSEMGGVMLMKKGEQLVGIVPYAKEEDVEVREPVYLPEYEQDYLRLMYQVRDHGDGIKVYGSQREDGFYEKKPVIMARVLYLPALLASMYVKEGEQIDCSFAVIDTELPQNNKIWKLQNDGHGRILVRESEDSEGVLSMALLTEVLFGVKTPEEAAESEEPPVMLSERLKRELGKIRPLTHIFLNEVV